VAFDSGGGSDNHIGNPDRGLRFLQGVDLVIGVGL
jgi:hypothetical protein